MKLREDEIKKKEGKGLTAIATRPVINPACTTADKYLESKFKKWIERGFIPLLKWPTCVVKSSQAIWEIK